MNFARAERGPIPIRSSYPMLRAGGAFLLFIGLGLVGAIAFSGSALVNYNIFYAGAGAGVVSLSFTRRLSSKRPTRLQVLALAAAIVLEVILFAVMVRTLPSGTEEQIRWLWVSAIVGVHFLPMSISFGPRFFVLGCLCIGNAVFGLLASSIPYEVFGIVDGTLKIGFGVWSLAGRGGAA
jgi:Family of unknown function (DUF6609)